MAKRDLVVGGPDDVGAATAVELISGPVRGGTVTAEISGVVVGRLVGVDPSGAPLVDHADNPRSHALRALTTTPLEGLETGTEVLLAFEFGDPSRPVVLGPLQVAVPAPAGVEKERSAIQCEIDGEVLTFTASRQIVLRCGKASITLTRAGKVLIRGAYLLNRSSGVNRIKGGSVQIN